MFYRCFLVVLLALSACGKPLPAFRNTDISSVDFGQRLEMPDHNGQLRHLDDFRGKAVVLFFGYTSCPDVCPTTLAKLAEVMQSLGAQAGKVQVLFVTLDPERDSPERLKAFLNWFGPNFLGLRADRAGTDAVAAEYRIYGARQEVGGAMGYVIDHTAGAYILDPAGRLRLYVSDRASVADIVADLGLLLDGR